MDEVKDSTTIVNEVKESTIMMNEVKLEVKESPMIMIQRCHSP